MNDYPGINNKPFKILFYQDWLKKGDYLIIERGLKVKVTKVYKRTWWRKLLYYFGVKTKLFDCVKVEPYENTQT